MVALFLIFNLETFKVLTEIIPNNPRKNRCEQVTFIIYEYKNIEFHFYKYKEIYPNQ